MGSLLIQGVAIMAIPFGTVSTSGFGHSTSALRSRNLRCLTRGDWLGLVTPYERCCRGSNILHHQSGGAGTWVDTVSIHGLPDW